MADKSFFARLSKLFSSNVIVRRIGKNRLRVVDSSRLQSSGNINNSRYTDRFSRLHGGSTSAATYNSNYNFHSSRIQLFGEFDQMDTDAIISSVLDITADESTMQNEYNEVLSIKSSDENVRKILYNLFYDILNIEFNLWPWIRNLLKYGDQFLYLHIEEGIGIVNVIPLSAYEMTREEMTDAENPYNVKFFKEGISGPRQELKNYEIAHFRLLSDSNFLPYGKSYIEGARKTWKQLVLLEDAMLIHRIMRAPEKRIFKVDVGNIPPSEVDQHMKNIINGTKKVPFVDENTGQLNLKFNIQNINEDYYLPTRGQQSSTDITTLPGLQYQAIEDVEYLKNKVLAALKVPKSFLGMENEAQPGKATLAAQDIRFARTIERIQRIVVSELTKIAIVHLAAQGYQDADLVNFELSLTSPSTVYEQEKIQIWQSKVTLARDAQQLQLLSDEWLYKNIFGMSEDEYGDEQQKVINNVKLKFRRTQIENEGNDPVVSGQSFGTPHDIASMHASRPGDKDFIEKDGKPADEEEWMQNVGRPARNKTYNTDKNTFGRDPLGAKENRKSGVDSNPLKHKFKGNSPLSQEGIKKMVSLMKDNKKITAKNKTIISESLKIEEKDSDKGTMLDEKNLLET